MAEQPFKALYQYGYRRSPDQDAPSPVHHPLVVVGAGPIGLAAAIDLAQRGHAVVLLDDNDKISEGSRAICFSKRALEVCDTLGVGGRMVDKGVTWNIGKVFQGDSQVYSFDLLPEEGHKRPAFINLQQYYVEAFLVERAGELDAIDLRWRNEVTAVAEADGIVSLTIETPDGPYRMTADWLIVCDGARSPVRTMLGEDFVGKVFEDRFLIADVKMKADFPTERWFWFDPPFHQGQSTLLHKQPDDVWRIDFQLGWDADPDEETKPEKVMPRLKAMLGEDTGIELEWVSVYTFQCKRMPKFVHGHIVFAGDAAHQVSPFGARGANSGFEDAHNIAWKLDAVLRGRAGSQLIASYGSERELAADDNIGHSTRATDFISPKSGMAMTFRNAALALAREYEFAKAFVNSGRLSRPSNYGAQGLNAADADEWNSVVAPGGAAVDAPLKSAHGAPVWLIDEIGPGFTLLCIGDVERNGLPADIRVLSVGSDLVDEDGLFTTRYDATPGAAWLFRPDQYLCARWRSPATAQIAESHRRALGHVL
jgi:3-(3-hydroxy-phenyl)propionate hydroxylase